MVAMSLRFAVLSALLIGVAAFADEDGGQIPDASLPDASVGQGGADRDNPESDEDMTPTTCQFDRDCSSNFHCLSGKCTYAGPRQIGGCFGGSAALAIPAVGLLLVRRRRFHTKGT